MTDEVLNPDLYAVLCDIFRGEVEVVNPGSPGDIVYTKKGLKYYAHAENGAQEFRVNCPYCGDTRGRLYINYLAVSNIKHRGLPVKTYHLMNCRNEGCSTIDLYKDLRKRVKNPPAITVKEIKKKARIDLRLPSPNYLINSKKAHAAPVAYMRSRGFDLDELAEVYGVRTCERVPGVEHLGQMVLFPSYDGARLTFWQARMAHDAFPGSRAPKYYFPTGTQKSEILYNRFHAIGEKMVVITEGVLDAIRVGKQGVSVFGKHPSVAQTRIMKRIFKRKMGVLMLDPDAAKEARKWYNKYKGDAIFGKGLFLCELQDKDPAEHTREELWEVIIDSLKKGDV